VKPSSCLSCHGMVGRLTSGIRLPSTSNFSTAHRSGTPTKQLERRITSSQPCTTQTVARLVVDNPKLYTHACHCPVETTLIAYNIPHRPASLVQVASLQLGGYRYYKKVPHWLTRV
jgi:hypothetical protein